MKKTYIGFVLLVLAALPATAQESLATILERGYIAHWLVCGPFTSDAEGGIAAAVARGDAPLGDRDYMAAAGGIARLRPEHRQVVESGDDLGLWQRAGTSDATLDLSPFFTDKTAGVSYAAFYAEAGTRTDVYFDLQTPLGARVWLNGFPEREIRAAPLSVVGVDRFVAALRPGMNLTVIEVPGADFDSLADAVDTTPRELGARAFSNRNLLTGKSGYEIALEIRPAANVGELFYVPRLESTGAFGGSASVVRQEAELIFFNPDTAPSPPVSVVIQPDTSLEPNLQNVPPVPPGQEYRLATAIPVGNTAVGGTVPVSVNLEADGVEASFQTSLSVREPVAAGNFYIVGGRWKDGMPPGIHGESTGALIESAARQAALAPTDSDYGFDLGEAALWDALLAARPDLVLPLRRLTQAGQVGTHAAYARPDHRLVSGEVLWRNMAWALSASRARLEEYSPSAILWDRPGIAPQYPQLLTLANIPGVVSNLEAAGLHPISWQHAPQGAARWHRRKEASPGPSTLQELRRMAALQRRELLGLAIDSDLLINQNSIAPPEPFLAGALERLAQSRPAIQFRGDGARRFFDDLSNTTETVRSEVPVSAGYWNAVAPGSVIAQPRLKQAYTYTHSLVSTAETFATFAALMGAEYPSAILDYGWRSLAYWGAPEILGVAQSREHSIDGLAGLQDVAVMADAIRDDAAAYIAREADTLSGAPLETAGVQALVVFNPSGEDRTAVCRTTITTPLDGRFGIQDDSGEAVPVLVDALRPAARGQARDAVVRFVARDVPSMGYRTYFVVPAQAPPPAPVKTADAQIESDRFALRVDPESGGIASLVDKTTGFDYAAGGVLNSLKLLAEDIGNTDGGHELWTSGASVTPSGAATIASAVSTDIQTVRAELALGDGTLEAIYTLSRGLPYVECALTLDGVDMTGNLAALAFPAPDPGGVLAAGERYGATTAGRSPQRDTYRSGDAAAPVTASLRSAYGWSGVGPGDRIQIGANTSVPLGRVAIVYGEEPMLRSASRELLRAFSSRAIAAEIVASEPDEPDFLWSDSTAHASHDAMLAGGLSLRVVIGSPEQNNFARHIAAALPDAMAAEFSDRLRQGGVWLLDDPDTPAEYPPTPTLLVAGLTAQRSAELAREVARGIRTLGYYSVPESMHAGNSRAEVPKHGIAVLYPGAHLASSGPDGGLELLLAHGDGIDGSADALRFDYAIYPHAGAWRDADVPQVAQSIAAPLFAVTTDLHSGSQAASQSLLRTSPGGLVVTAVKAAGYPEAEGASETPHPRDGVIVRGFESLGRSWRGSIDLFVPWRHASTATFVEGPGVALTTDERGIGLEQSPFSIANVWAMPSSRHAMGPAETLGTDGTLPGSVPTRYWRARLGPAPTGNLPLAISIQGRLDGDAPQVSVLVANRSAEKVLEGLAEVITSEGWSVGPARFYYRVEPGAYHRETLSIARSGSAAGPGGLAAWTVQDDTTYRDVLLEEGAVVSLEVIRTGAQVKATVRNRSGLTAEGRIDFVVAPAQWVVLGHVDGVTATPHAQSVSVPPYGEQDYLFALSDADAAPWAAARLAAHGRAVYETVPGP